MYIVFHSVSCICDRIRLKIGSRLAATFSRENELKMCPA